MTFTEPLQSVTLVRHGHVSLRHGFGCRNYITIQDFARFLPKDKAEDALKVGWHLRLGSAGLQLDNR